MTRFYTFNCGFQRVGPAAFAPVASFVVRATPGEAARHVVAGFPVVLARSMDEAVAKAKAYATEWARIPPQLTAGTAVGGPDDRAAKPSQDGKR